LTGQGYTGYINLRVVRGKIEVVETRATWKVEERGRMSKTIPSHDLPDNL
jgi:hypothetical protein